MKKIVKFGGSSLANAEQFQKVGEIIRSDESRRYVVPSAPGKRFDGDTKVTDLLYKCYNTAVEGEDFIPILQEIKGRYYEIIRGLNLDLSLEDEFAQIEGDFKAQAGTDYAASRGEFLNGKVMAAYLGYEFVDAADVIRFDKNGNLDAEKTDRLLSKKLAKCERAVIPGFYGAGEDGKVKTFSRGGSDVTGSLVAKAIKADLYENWTDVSGFLVTDPRIVKNPEVIESITYRELRELSYMGATVLHEDAIFPVRKEGIPINIKNTNRPEDKGTFIVESTCKKPKFTITGIAGKKGFCSINIEKSMMNSEVGFGRKVLQVFEDQGISFEHVPSGIDTMTVYVHQDEFEEKEQQVIAGIHRAVQPDFVEMESDLALIAVVGRGMKSTRGTAGRIFSALAHANVNVKMIDQGSSELNIIIGVENRDFETAVKAIYDIFVITQI
ncbi:aspartate kinase [Blautia wexlerae]|jgi:aspartate kinase|uniref:aspartate kinase n=1 Tax=Blautia wexlerae TaxID=418240 RepID=UPI000E4AB833|nr:aspartate kinase [Ruminococcus sp. AM18-44]RHO27678.1 aspartate kinase [Ruminococcus sp. AM18-15]RHS62706.1 aspartate kinase [Ruminococcus sp. AM45-9BH]RHS76158.1 aspartate kinase [Ruminococcus sp. AM45-2]RHS79342.1 aspartate kinase [Ruminococcus sp. AM44-9AT]